MIFSGWERIAFHKKIRNQEAEQTYKKAKVILFTNLNFKDKVRAKCIQVNTKNLHFISPVVHRYFSDDQELMTLVRKVRNYKRHLKTYYKRVEVLKLPLPT